MIDERYIKRLKRKLKRCREQALELEAKHSGNEQNYTYHGGFSLGYLEAQINEIEDFIDQAELQEHQSSVNVKF